MDKKFQWIKVNATLEIKKIKHYKSHTIQVNNTGQSINPGQCKFRIKKVKAKIKARKKSQNDQATKRSGSMDKK